MLSMHAYYSLPTTTNYYPGYLVFMIFLKWSTDWVAIAQQPPSLLNTLISMFMAPGVYTEESPPASNPNPNPDPNPNLTLTLTLTTNPNPNPDPDHSP